MILKTRKKIGDYLLYGFITKVQKITGFTSKVPNSDAHYILFDFDNINLEKLKDILYEVKEDFKLGNIYIMSDKPSSYRAFCLTPVDFNQMLHILLHTTPYLDFMFFKWTVKRGYATIRISEKLNRAENKVTYIIGNAEEKLELDKMIFVEYDTDVDGKELII